MNEELNEIAKGKDELIIDHEERVELMVKDLDRQKELRSAFKRRRVINPDEKVTYISEDNRKYNNKLYKYFGSYVKDLDNKDSKPTV